MKDSWLRDAISDDTLVADLLLHLKDSPPAPPPQSAPPPNHYNHHHTIVLKWGLRLPRSKPSTTSSNTSTSFDFKPRRCSPTTPLSWTPSDGCDVDDSSLSSHLLPPPSDRFRSKVSACTETPATTTSKRPRKKKTFSELKEEESSLLKERIYLKKELATLRQSVKEQRSIHENLKRIKLDLHVETRVKSETNSVDDRNNTSNGVSEAASSSITRPVEKVEDTSEPDSQEQRATSQEQLFALPDLNMLPEEDTITVGMS